MGIKHNVVAQIYLFSQKENESVWDCANHLRQYISRCLAREIPSSQRLISLFLESLKNKSLHANLYGKNHDTLYNCIKDAIDFDDNCEIYGNVDKKIHSPSETSSLKSGKTQETSLAKTDVISDLVVKKMNKVLKP